MLKHDKNGYIPVKTQYNNGFSYQGAHKNQEDDNSHPFMPFKSDRVSQEHIELIGSSIIGFKDEPKMIGYGDVESE